MDVLKKLKRFVILERVEYLLVLCFYLGRNQSEGTHAWILSSTNSDISLMGCGGSGQQ